MGLINSSGYEVESKFGRKAIAAHRGQSECARAQGVPGKGAESEEEAAAREMLESPLRSCMPCRTRQRVGVSSGRIVVSRSDRQPPSHEATMESAIDLHRE